jgi:hypothetical protein
MEFVVCELCIARIKFLRLLKNAQGERKKSTEIREHPIVPNITNSVAPELESSSPHSQQPANDPYSEPGESTTCPLI